jgi:TonB-dependent starch-binding outer membrane protein SusC
MKKFFLLVGLIFSAILGISQNKVTGTVVDGDTDQPIENAKISILNGKSTTTNKSGKFTLKVDSTDTVFFTAEGYQMEATSLGDAKKVKVKLGKQIAPQQMVEDSYGSQTKRSSTSAVTVVERNNMNAGVANDIYELLRGRVPGLQIINGSGNPTDKPIIMLRGAAGFNYEQEPLIVIDGVIGASLSSIDPNDVASVTVLRDGSATAAYGSRANAGVLLIKSKRAKSAKS